MTNMIQYFEYFGGHLFKPTDPESTLPLWIRHNMIHDLSVKSQGPFLDFAQIYKC